MGEPLVDSNAKGVGSSLCCCRSTSRNASFEHISCACFEDESFEAGIISRKDGLDKEIETAFAEVMHVYDDDDEGAGPGEDSDENDESILSLESDSTDGLVETEAELVISSAFPIDNASESSIGKPVDGNFPTNGIPMLVSAMKGSRAKRGIVTKLSVSWAPDVYDPPVTSESHTLRAHQRSSRKSHYKYKPPKGSNSSSRGSYGSKKDKKHSRHSSSSSSSSSRSDKKPSQRSINGGSRRTDTTNPEHCKVYGSSVGSTTHTCIPQCGKLSPWMPADIASFEDSAPVPVPKTTEQSADTTSLEEAAPLTLPKTMEQLKRSASNCKVHPLSMLSRQFVATKYKGMFSLWNQNQLAS